MRVNSHQKRSIEAGIEATIVSLLSEVDFVSAIMGKTVELCLPYHKTVFAVVQEWLRWLSQAVLVKRLSKGKSYVQ